MYMGDQVLGYTCTMCSKFYKMWSNYLKHKCEPPQFKCPLCPFAAFKAFILHAHQAEQHFKVTSPNTSCGKAFKWRKSLVRHEREECGKKPYHCPHCPREMSLKNSLIRHLLVKHGQDCRARTRVVRRPSSRRVENCLGVAMDGFHECCECKRMYRSRMALNRHVREECGRVLYTCPFCHSIMPMKFNLLKHLKKEHGKEFSKQVGTRIEDTLTSSRRTGCPIGNQMQQLHHCRACGNEYMCFSSLKRHVREECGQPPKYQCPYCPKRTKLRCNLLKHMHFGLLHWVRTPSMPRRVYPCGKCQKIYANASSLYRHLKLECGILPQFHCPYCRFSSKRKFNLDSHVAHKHRKLLQCYGNRADFQRNRMSRVQASPKKPYPCKHCDRSYMYKSTLKRHIQYECGKEKQFVCPVCHKKLTLSGLQKHRIGVH
ncbi:zinc finger Y-chromosomal protein 1-like [Colletes latitarsis]|uniref:zinc finger Y-chromosomal protein 1-like n=1 Tax=Colletes latitarsis TaxID=2605962 RepID=UPI004036FC95